MALAFEKSLTIDGLIDLQAALAELPNATAKNVLKRVLTDRSAPIVADAKQGVRVETGALRDSIGVGTRLSRRQASLHRVFGSRSAVEVFIGPGALPQAITEEFGTVDQEPHPFLRPAWDAGKDTLLAGIKADIWAEIEKAAKRLARKTARLARKG